jgi:hypothetical protein
MNRCSGCGYIVPGAWTECRRCGTPVSATPVRAPAGQVATRNGLALAPPPPLAPLPPLAPPPPTGAYLAPARPAPARPDPSFGAPDDALLPGVHHPRPAVPDTMLPRIDPTIISTPTAHSRWNRNHVVAAIAAFCVVVGGYALMPHGGHAKKPPTVLAGRPPAAGIPTSLSDVVRIAAESARHTALTTVIATAGTTGQALTLSQLAAAQPNYEWVIGSEPSTTNTVVSITSGTGIDVIAVSGTDRDICAFGRWSPSIGSDYVTMAHVTHCAATNAPIAGWSSLPGGSAQDLPGVDGS